jgi:RHS repeat-associated protein
MKRFFTACGLAAGLLSTSNACAVDYAEEFARKIQAARAIAPLGTDLFGDSTDWYSGTTTFRVVDVDIPGNSALPVRIVRTRSTAPPEGPTTPGLMGDWELELPCVSSVFAQGSAWNLPSTTQNRCSSGPLIPPAIAHTSGSFQPEEYWRGYHLAIPGQGSTHLLWRNATYIEQPSDGYSYPWVTVGHTQVRCGISLANGTGEGFLAVTPDGVKYRFDWIVSRPYSIFNDHDPGTQFVYSLPRDEVRIYATRVEDRFGNYVTYTYSGEKLTRIESNDGRVITLAYNASNKVATVTAEAAAPASNRTWTYGYQSGVQLTGVTLPDGSAWSLSTSALILTYINEPPPTNACNLPTSFVSGNVIWTMTHPAGASAQFTFAPKRHARTQIPLAVRCKVIEGMIEPGPSLEFDTYALVTKALYGVGLTTATWSVTYGATANDQKIVTQTNPDNTKARYTFGTRFYQDEGKVLREEILASGGAVLRNTQTSYAINPTGQRYAYRVGSTLQPIEDAFGSVLVTATLSTTITQDSATFTRSTPLSDLDEFAQPESVAKSSTLGFAKTEVIAYRDPSPIWVLGQVESVTVGSEYPSRTEYHPSSALPWKEYAFGPLSSPTPMRTLMYNADGTLSTIVNGAGETTTLSSWKRGLPRLIQYPDTSSQSAVVDDNGWIRSVTDERTNTTSYGYDALGRITSITYPGSDTVTWLNPAITYVKLTSTELGFLAGTWRRQETLGTYRERTYYDGRLRPLLRERKDTASGGAVIYDRHAYDYESQETFTSYPSSTSAAAAGINATYDALGRLTKRQTTDATPIVLEQIAYLTGSQRRVTDADGKQTTLSYQAFDAPDYSLPTRIESHGQISTTDIARDEFGKVDSISQSGSYGGGTLGFTRTFWYDEYERPCRREDPESASTVWGYDAASRVVWEKRGVTGSGCPASAPSNQTIFTYDLRGRLKVTNHPGTADDVTRNYDLAGNLSSIVSATTTWTYVHNKRNLVESEQAQIDGKTWLLNPGYNNRAQVTSFASPARTVTYAVDAFGRPTQLGTYVTGIQYHPNGLPSSYSLSNGLTFTRTLDTQLRPWVQETKLGSAILQRYVYSYSDAGDLEVLDDQGDGADDATLGYDDLHRLDSAIGLWGSVGYTYDPLHNLRTRTGPGALTYSYNASNQLSGISGSQTRTYGYNAKGYITGDGTQTFAVNPDGQITSITGVAGYAYDGNGRRIRVTPQSGTIEYALYSRAGDLAYTEKGTEKTDFLKLAGQTLVELKKVGSATTVTWLHPDLLGSPRKATSATALILWTEHYDPWGKKLNGVAEKIGYTGHAHDAESGYAYMQARFYDPSVGRFLSTDPVHFQDDNPFTFNRYAYANNNPYKYTDPTGREIKIVGDQKFVAAIQAAIDKIEEKEGGKVLISQLKESENIINIRESPDGRNGTTPAAGDSSKKSAKGVGSAIDFNPDETSGGKDENGGYERPIFVGLAHELGHAKAMDNGTQSYDVGTGEQGTTPPSEQESMAVENMVRKEHDLPSRPHYYEKDN